jgi:hypothetical protein
MGDTFTTLELVELVVMIFVLEELSLRRCWMLVRGQTTRIRLRSLICEGEQ